MLGTAAKKLHVGTQSVFLCAPCYQAPVGQQPWVENICKHPKQRANDNIVEEFCAKGV